MAKQKPGDGKYQATQIETKSSNGLSAHDLIAFAAGKKPGDKLTEKDIDVAISKAGISDKDARDIRKSASKFVGEGKKFLLEEDGTYNVKNAQGDFESSSSKGAGNKRGFNPGDLVGLGNKMSKVVGLANSFKEDYKKAQQTPTPSKPAEQPAQQGQPSTPTDTQLLSAGKKRTSTSKSTGDRRLTPAEIASAQSRAQVMSDSLNIPQEGEGFGFLPASLGGGTGRTVEGQVNSKDNGVSLGQHMIGKFNEGVMMLPADILNLPRATANLIGLNTPDENSQMITAQMADWYTKNIAQSDIAKSTYSQQNPAYNDSFLASDLPRFAPSVLLTRKTPGGRSMQNMATKPFTKVGTAASRVAGNVSGKVAQTAGIYGRGVTKLASKKAGQGLASQLKFNIGPVQSEVEAAQRLLPQFGTRTPAQLGTMGERFIPRGLPQVGTKSKYITQYPRSDFNPSRSKALYEMSSRMAEGFRKGGKIMAGGGSFAQIDEDEMERRFRARMAADLAARNGTAPITSITPAITQQQGNYTAANLSSQGGGKNMGRMSGADIAQVGGGMAIAGLTTILANRALNKVPKVKAPVIQLSQPIVGPKSQNFTVQDRTPLGSSLAEQSASLDNRQAIANTQRLEYEKFKDDFIKDQIFRRADTENRGRMMNAQFDLQGQMANQQRGMQVQAMKANNIMDLGVGAKETLESTLAQNADRGIDKAYMVLRYPDMFTPEEQVRAKKLIMGN